MRKSGDWKATNKHLNILQAAAHGRYGVIAAIAYNIEQILGLIAAAEEKRAPLILQFFPWAISFSNGLLVRAAADAVKRASVPISIHLDHAQDIDLIRKAADELPFDSIMVDMSHYEKEENLQKTRELVAYCAVRLIATEAEPGRIEGREDGIVGTEDLAGSMTTLEEVKDFVATGVDVIAPAIGNIHGDYVNPPQLDFQRLQSIRSELASGNTLLALHGTNDFKPELMKQCISNGITKVNVNKLVLNDYSLHLQKAAHELPLSVLMERGVQKVQSLTMAWMDICGSSGQA